MRPLRILLIAADPLLRKRAAGKLTRAGHVVDYATDDDAGRCALSARKYSLLITDSANPWTADLPPKILRTPQSNLSVPVVMLSGCSVVGVVNPSPRPAPWFNVFLHRRFGRLTLLRAVTLILGKRSAAPAATRREPPAPRVVFWAPLPS